MPNTQSMRCHVVSFLCRVRQTYKPSGEENQPIDKSLGKKKKQKEALRANVSEHETDFFKQLYIDKR